ncbi:MAG TPA: hypothetical protein PLV92_12990, partial [Pirellulaceae bacterium]|nr:hypothetical protein [Pirellulaceae bacterium]
DASLVRTAPSAQSAPSPPPAPPPLDSRWPPTTTAAISTGASPASPANDSITAPPAAHATHAADEFAAAAPDLAAPPPPPPSFPLERYRSWIVQAAAVGIGVVLALGVFVVVMRWVNRGSSTGVAQGPNATSGSSDRGDGASQPNSVGTPSGGGTSEHGPPVKPDDGNTKPGDGNPAAEKPAVDKPSVDKPAQVEPAPEKPTPEKPAIEKPTLEKPAQEKPTQEEPPKEQPGSGKAGGEKPTNSKPAPDDDPLGPPDLRPKPREGGGRVGPDPVAGRFNALIGGLGALDAAPGDLPPEKPTVNPPAGEKPPAGAGPGSDIEILRPRMREVDVAARLADPLAQIEFEGVPLCDYLQVLSDLSTIPITLDLDALRLRNVAPTATVTVKIEETTVRAALVAALQPLKLGFVAAGGHVVVTHPAPTAATTAQPQPIDVSDLIADKRLKTELTPLIQELIEPDSWSEAGGEGTLTLEDRSLLVGNTESVRLQVLLLLDKLRAARGLPARGKFNPLLLQPDAVGKRCQSALQTAINLNFSRPTRLTQILNRFGKVAGLKILVDWQALSDVGWPPETNATITVTGAPLSEALTQLLGPRELTYRVVDEGLIEVTTPAAASRRLDWEWHSLAPAASDDAAGASNDAKSKEVNSKETKPGDGKPAAAAVGAASRDEMRERIQESVGARFFREFGGPGLLRFDDAGRGYAIAVLPFAQQKIVAEAIRGPAPPASDRKEPPPPP